MKVRIDVDKVTALKAGKDRHGRLVVEVPAADFTPQEVEILGRYAYDGNKPEADFYLDRARYESYGASRLGLKENPYKMVGMVAAEPTAEGVHAVLAEIARADELVARAEADLKRREAEEREALILSFLEKPAEELVSQSYRDQPWTVSRQFESLAEDDGRLTARLQEAEALVAELNAKREAELAAEKESKAAEKARLVREKRDWVEAHGSDYLRKALRSGYDCQRQYVTERAALEHPGYAVDFDDNAEWGDRSCPSMEALDEAEASGGRVVWLKEPVVTPDEYEEWAEREAVVIDDYLGHYDLVKEMDHS